MPRKTPQTTPQQHYLMRLDESPKALTAAILEDPQIVKSVPTEQLVSLYVQGHQVAAKVGKVLDTVKDEIKANRRTEGLPYGDENQHRRLDSGYGGSVCIEERRYASINMNKATKYLKENDLMQEACNLEITSGVPAFQSFLWKNRKFLKENGIEVREVIDLTKLEALVGMKKIPLEDFEAMLDKKPASYAVKVGK